MRKERFNITGMTCSACSARVERAVKKMEGTAEVSVNLLTNTMTLAYDAAVTSPAAIIAVVEDAGYGASVKGGDGAQTAPQSGSAADAGADAAERATRAMRSRLLTSILFLLPTMYLAMSPMLAMWGVPYAAGFHEVFWGAENALTFALAQFVLVLPIMYVNRPYYVNGFRNLLHGAPNMDTLVGIGSMASALFGVFAMFRMSWGLGHGDLALAAEYSTNLYFESAGMIVTLITVGKYLEARAKGQTTGALRALMQLAPAEATVVRGGVEQIVPVVTLVLGDTVIVRPGARIPVDGTVTDGATSIDESAVTGESMPVPKTAGDTVTSGTLNVEGTIRFTATRVGEDTTIRRLIRLVDEASGSKAPIARLADRVSAIFVPTILVISLLTLIGWLVVSHDVPRAFNAAVSVLVIACPCALGLATPTALLAGTGRGSQLGILIRNAQVLETTHTVNRIVLDKTGTVTEGTMRVARFGTFDDFTEVTDDNASSKSERSVSILSDAAAVEALSEHPIARAIARFATENYGAFLGTVENFEGVPGGVRGELVRTRDEGKSRRLVLVGTPEYLLQAGVSLTEKQHQMLEQTRSEGLTTVAVARAIGAKDPQPVGLIALADSPKPESGQAIAELHELGLEPVLLTGDAPEVAQAIASSVGINPENVFAGVTPERKSEVIAQLQDEGYRVAMVGDGVNDAPALARADLGMAMGSGTDVAVQASDIVLMRSDMRAIPTSLRLSRATLHTIKSNLFWAFAYNTIAVPVAAAGLLNPMIAAAAMAFSSVFVVLNSMRLTRFER